MMIGCTRERKNHEYRVGLTPGNVRAYIQAGHTVLMERGAGVDSGFTDEEYAAQGAEIIPGAEEICQRCEMLVKVKEPEPGEFPLLKKGMILYTYLHLAAFPELAQYLLENEVSAVAYETVRDSAGSLPCLRPMSEIAGRLSVQEGAKYLEYAYGGHGILLGGVPGVERGKVVIIGGGIAGTYAAKAAVGMGSETSTEQPHVSKIFIGFGFFFAITWLRQFCPDPGCPLFRSLQKKVFVSYRIGKFRLVGSSCPQILSI